MLILIIFLLKQRFNSYFSFEASIQLLRIRMRHRDELLCLWPPYCFFLLPLAVVRKMLSSVHWLQFCICLSVIPLYNLICGEHEHKNSICAVYRQIVVRYTKRLEEMLKSTLCLHSVNLVVSCTICGALLSEVHWCIVYTEKWLPFVMFAATKIPVSN